MQLLSVDIHSPYFYLGLFVAIIALVFLTTREPSFNPVEPPKKLVKDMGPEELSQYNYEKSKVLLLALKGVIYDVSHSQAYQQGGPYCSFTGHDASVSLAKMSHDKEFLDKDGIVALNEDEQKILDDWVVYFNNKYHIVGKLLTGTKTE